MKTTKGFFAGLAAAGLAAGLWWGFGQETAAQETLDVQTLRGDFTISETAPAEDSKRQNTDPGAMGRAYRQQPPLIPHRIEGYQITTRVNKCKSCHDWPNNVKEGAPKISETHYTDRNGVALDRVAGHRWFCTQCHVPQANARALVRNDFKSAVEVE